jgi:hypothetical protein
MIDTTNNVPELNRLHHLLSKAEKFLADTNNDAELRTRLAVTALDLIINEATTVRAQLEGSNAS